jgi:tetratricopeptide (TPR) repeat protein
LTVSTTLLQANEAFAAGETHAALATYSAALAFVDEDLLMQVGGTQYEAHARGARAPLLANAAACHLRLQEWDAAVATSGEALQLAPEGEGALRSKALFRRAAARRALRQTEGAEADIRAALQLCAP